MSSREFEYAAMRAMSGDIVLQIDKPMLLTFLERNGLRMYDTGEDTIVYPANSPRKNPACVVVSRVAGVSGWSAIKSIGHGRYVYIYKAGDYDLERGCEKAGLRSEGKSAALRAGQDSVYKQHGKRGITALL